MNKESPFLNKVRWFRPTGQIFEINRRREPRKLEGPPPSRSFATRYIASVFIYCFAVFLIASALIEDQGLTGGRVLIGALLATLVTAYVGFNYKRNRRNWKSAATEASPSQPEP